MLIERMIHEANLVAAKAEGENPFETEEEDTWASRQWHTSEEWQRRRGGKWSSWKKALRLRELGGRTEETLTAVYSGEGCSDQRS